MDDVIENWWCKLGRNKLGPERDNTKEMRRSIIWAGQMIDLLSSTKRLASSRVATIWRRCGRESGSLTMLNDTLKSFILLYLHGFNNLISTKIFRLALKF
jgi:hypothetical protein